MPIVDNHTQNGNSHQLVGRLSVFELAGKYFGLDILSSREVISLPRYTPLPNTDGIFCGVFNLRGEIFPLVDVSPIVGLPRKQIQPSDMVILIESSAEFVIGVIVDRIHRVIPYSAVDIKIPRGLVAKPLESFTMGVLNYKSNLIHILDLKRLIQSKEMHAHF